MYKPVASWNDGDRNVIAVEAEICAPEQPLIMPVQQMPFQLLPNDPFQQMRNANRDYRTFEEWCRISQQIARTHDLNTSYTNMVSLLPKPLEPFFGELTNHLQDNPVYAVAAYLAFITGLQITGCVLAILTGLAASLQGRVRVRINDKWVEPIIIRSLQVAPSGNHKSQVCAPILTPFYDYEKLSFCGVRLTKEEAKIAETLLRKERSTFTKNMDLFAEGALDALKEFASQINKSPITKALEQTSQPVQVITTESTAYAVQNLMAANGGAMFFAAPEGTGIDKLFEKTKLATINQSFNHEPITYTYGKKKISISYPSLNML